MSTLAYGGPQVDDALADLSAWLEEKLRLDGVTARFYLFDPIYGGLRAARWWPRWLEGEDRKVRLADVRVVLQEVAAANPQPGLFAKDLASDLEQLVFDPQLHDWLRLEGWVGRTPVGHGAGSALAPLYFERADDWLGETHKLEGFADRDADEKTEVRLGVFMHALAHLPISPAEMGLSGGTGIGAQAEVRVDGAHVRSGHRFFAVHADYPYPPRLGGGPHSRDRLLAHVLERLCVQELAEDAGAGGSERYTLGLFCLRHGVVMPYLLLDGIRRDGPGDRADLAQGLAKELIGLSLDAGGPPLLERYYADALHVSEMAALRLWSLAERGIPLPRPVRAPSRADGDSSEVGDDPPPWGAPGMRLALALRALGGRRARKETREEAARGPARAMAFEVSCTRWAQPGASAEDVHELRVRQHPQGPQWTVELATSWPRGAGEASEEEVAAAKAWIERRLARNLTLAQVLVHPVATGGTGAVRSLLELTPREWQALLAYKERYPGRWYHDFIAKSHSRVGLDQRRVAAILREMSRATLGSPVEELDAAAESSERGGDAARRGGEEGGGADPDRADEELVRSFVDCTAQGDRTRGDFRSCRPCARCAVALGWREFLASVGNHATTYWEHGGLPLGESRELRRLAPGALPPGWRTASGPPGDFGLRPPINPVLPHKLVREMLLNAAARGVGPVAFAIEAFERQDGGEPFLWLAVLNTVAPDRAATGRGGSRDGRTGVTATLRRLRGWRAAYGCSFFRVDQPAEVRTPVSALSREVRRNRDRFRGTAAFRERFDWLVGWLGGEATSFPSVAGAELALQQAWLFMEG